MHHPLPRPAASILLTTYRPTPGLHRPDPPSTGSHPQAIRRARAGRWEVDGSSSSELTSVPPPSASAPPPAPEAGGAAEGERAAPGFGANAGAGAGIGTGAGAGAGAGAGVGVGVGVGEALGLGDGEAFAAAAASAAAAFPGAAGPEAAFPGVAGPEEALAEELAGVARVRGVLVAEQPQDGPHLKRINACQDILTHRPCVTTGWYPPAHLVVLPLVGGQRAQLQQGGRQLEGDLHGGPLGAGQIGGGVSVLVPQRHVRAAHQ
eukprot:1184465-Prorocentrum_minimum.AAC.2